MDTISPECRVLGKRPSNTRVTLAVAVARIWTDVYSNAVDPGWVPTKMGGPGAPDDLRLGHLTPGMACHQ